MLQTPPNICLDVVAGIMLCNTLFSSSVHEAFPLFLSGPTCLHVSTASLYAW